MLKIQEIENLLEGGYDNEDEFGNPEQTRANYEGRLTVLSQIETKLSENLDISTESLTENTCDDRAYELGWNAAITWVLSQISSETYNSIEE